MSYEVDGNKARRNYENNWRINCFGLIREKKNAWREKYLPNT